MHIIQDMSVTSKSALKNQKGKNYKKELKILIPLSINDFESSRPEENTILSAFEIGRHFTNIYLCNNHSFRQENYFHIRLTTFCKAYCLHYNYWW